MMDAIDVTLMQRQMITLFSVPGIMQMGYLIDNENTREDLKA